jgi:hypothetical protein
MRVDDLGIENRLRRAKGRDRRSRSVGTKTTSEEEMELIQAARAEGKFVSEWAREVLLRAARESIRPRNADAFLTELLSEIIGVRLLLVNLLKPQAAGEKPLTLERFEAMLTEIQKVKKQLALKVQEQLENR